MIATKIHKKYEHLYPEHLHGLNFSIHEDIQLNTSIPVLDSEVQAISFKSGQISDYSPTYHAVLVDHTEYGVRHLSPLGKALNGR
jgi:hypothetical protein